MNRRYESRRLAQGNPGGPESPRMTMGTQGLSRLRRRAIRETERFLSHQLADLREMESPIEVGESAFS